jgi:hypothetical protein
VVREANHPFYCFFNVFSNFLLLHFRHTVDKCNWITLILREKRNRIDRAIEICVSELFILVDPARFFLGILFRLGFGRLEASIRRTHPLS